jgi:hypothetical protein
LSCLLPRGESDDVVDAVAVVVPHSRHLHERPEVPQPARVVHEMIDGDALAVVGQLGDVLAHVIVERETPLLDEQRDRGRRELLGDGPEMNGVFGVMARRTRGSPSRSPSSR